MIKYASLKRNGVIKLDITALIVNVGVLFIMMVPGVILKKCGFIQEGFGKGISNLVLYIAQPTLIVYAYLSCESKFSDIWFNCLMTFILSMAAHVIFAAASMLLFKRADSCRQRMLRFATIFSNAAFMGIPLIQAILGAEAAIYASIYNISFNLFLWTLGVHICTKVDYEDLDNDGDCDLKDGLLSAKANMKKEMSMLKLLLHPVTLASVIGVILLACNVNISLLNDIGLGIVTTSLEMIKNLVAPLSMLVIGLRLTDIKLKGVFRDTGMYIFLLMRHFVLPFAIVLVMLLLSLCGVEISYTTRIVITLLAATPAASSAAMFAEKYDCDVAYVSQLVVISTLFSIISMPLLVGISELLF